MKTTTKTEFLAALEAQDILWPVVQIGNHVYGQHVGGEIWRAIV